MRSVSVYAKRARVGGVDPYVRARIDARIELKRAKEQYYNCFIDPYVEYAIYKIDRFVKSGRLAALLMVMLLTVVCFITSDEELRGCCVLFIMFFSMGFFVCDKKPRF